MINKRGTLSYYTFYGLLTISWLLLANCGRWQEAAAHKKEFRQIYIDQFKLTYFRSLLLKSYNNSDHIQNIIDLDRSGFTEPILTIEDHKLIDSLTTADNILLTIDSTSSMGRAAEGAEGKHILGYVMQKLQSNWLDSLARRRYRYAKVDEQYPFY